MNKEREIDSKKEHVLPPESLSLRTGVIAISGESGTGKSMLAESLAEFFGVENLKTGRKFREMGEERTDENDRVLDQFQRDIIRNANSQKPIVLEGRLAAFIVGEERLNNPNLPVVTLILTASYETRMQRIETRLLEEQREKLKKGEKTETVSLSEIKRKEKEREALDKVRWERLYPQITGIDPFSPYTRIEGKRIYDVIIDTENKNPEETFIEAIKQLIRLGVVGYTKPIPKQETIFYS